MAKRTVKTLSTTTATMKIEKTTINTL